MMQMHVPTCFNPRSDRRDALYEAFEHNLSGAACEYITNRLGMTVREAADFTSRMYPLDERFTASRDPGWVKRYASAPASASHHLNFPGGLVAHSLGVTKRLLENKECKWARDESPYIVGMMHDICKMDAYELIKVNTAYPQPDPGPAYEYVKARQLFPGHGTLSAMLAPYYLGFPLTRQEMVCIAYHMGAWCIDKDYPVGFLDAGMKAYPVEVIATQHADMMASQCDEAEV